VVLASNSRGVACQSIIIIVDKPNHAALVRCCILSGRRLKIRAPMKSVSCTYIGHATTLIRLGQVNIITDPNFSRRTFFFFPRKVPLPFAPSDLPDLACVLLSHTHPDSLDFSSYKYISCGVPIVVPEGSERAVGKHLPNPVIELSHYADYELPDGTEITAVPVIHRSGRLSHLRYTKSNAYLIRQEGSGSVYFCSDSSYGPHFQEVGNLGPIDLALLPIGCYEPRWLLKNQHMTPTEAICAFEDLKARHMVPIHYGTFRITLEPLEAPAEWLENILLSRPDLSDRIHPLKPGESYTVEAKDA